MEQDNLQRNNNESNSRFLSGVFIVGFGALLLLYKMNFPIPHWIFSWESILIAIGIYTGIKSRFQNYYWIIFILIGGLFLFDDIVTTINIHAYITPILIITVGLIFIMKPKRSCKKNRDWNKWTGYDNTFTNVKDNSSNTINATDEEWLDINTFFGGVERKIYSKNFKGGEINCFMAGVEINLLQADMQHPVKLQLNNIFGGTKIIAPANWEIKNEIVAVFGGVEDKRNLGAVLTDPNKTLIIQGNCFFGGVEFKNY